jgi:hypothetical protein
MFVCSFGKLSFIKENATSFLRKSSSPLFLQELRPLTPLKTTDRFTSLTVIGMMKIMCNIEPPKVSSYNGVIDKILCRVCVGNKEQSVENLPTNKEIQYNNISSLR